MRVIVVGLGVQGYKRREHAEADYVASVDPVNPEADYKKIEEVPLDSYDAALLCVPDEPKVELVRYCLNNKKHALVEKPMWAAKDEQIRELEKLSHDNAVACYTAYNHRFEPHFIKTKKILDSGIIGKVYNVELYYGNGTAKLWKNSWREKNKYSILHDLGVHLLDTFNFWFEFMPEKFNTAIKSKNELHCFDFINFNSYKKFKSSFTVSVIDWRNKFEANIIGQKGSIHINSLCKWGPSRLTIRKRIFPSGKPKEKIFTKICSDPTWKLEEKYFRKISKEKLNNFSNDSFIKKSLNKIL